MLTRGVSDSRKIFGRRLRQAREAKGWTQSEFAEAVGGALDVTGVSRYEAGKAYPRADRLESMAQALDVSTVFLSGHEEYPSVNPTMLIDALRAAEVARDELTTVIRALRSVQGYNVVNLRGASLAAEKPSVKAASEGGNLEKGQAAANERKLYLVDGEEHEGTYLGDSTRDGDQGDN